MTPGTTHHPACWRDPKHHECAAGAVVRLVELVRRLEWSAGLEGQALCPACRRERNIGHRDGCWIGVEIEDDLEGLE